MNSRSFDQRRDLISPGDAAATLAFSVQHFIDTANEAINRRGQFCVALSGGSTPKGIYQALVEPKNRDRLNWKRVFLFWSDERAVPATDPESNFRMAMDCGLGQLVPSTQIFRMEAEKDIDEGALRYEKVIKTHISDQTFDLVMLGIGEDGHIASLFPYTQGLEVENRQVIANYIPQKKCWRMTLTYDPIQRARAVVIYVFGANKQKIVAEVLRGPEDPLRLPAQRVGTALHKCLWVVDREAGQGLSC